MSGKLSDVITGRGIERQVVLTCEERRIKMNKLKEVISLFSQMKLEDQVLKYSILCANVLGLVKKKRGVRYFGFNSLR